jgi:hypothetical protein
MKPEVVSGLRKLGFFGLGKPALLQVTTRPTSRQRTELLADASSVAIVGMAFEVLRFTPDSSVY